MGSDQAGKNEIDPQALADADLYVCDRVSQCELLGELRARSRRALDRRPARRNWARWSPARCPGRPFAEAVTICDLTGTGAQDTAIATHALRAADAGALIAGEVLFDLVAIRDVNGEFNLAGNRIVSAEGLVAIDAGAAGRRADLDAAGFVGAGQDKDISRLQFVPRLRFRHHHADLPNTLACHMPYSNLLANCCNNLKRGYLRGGEIICGIPVAAQ
jgi:hypothetical protein